VYPKREIDFVRDILRMTEIPLLAIEILSPSQVIQELIDKIEIYINAGVQSSWLVIPTTCTVTVYHDFKSFESFSQGQIIDKKLAIHLELNEIFSF
jgi:Uma2 family endonuclease